MKKEVILMFSGDINSLAARRFLLNKGYEVRSVYVDLGHALAWKEKSFIDLLDFEVRKMFAWELSFLKASDSFVYLRNLFLACFGSYLGDLVVIASRRSKRDSSPIFFLLTSILLSFLNKRTIRIWSPFLSWTKEDAMIYLLNHEEKAVQLILDSPSCIDENEYFCGHCKACIEKYLAMKVVGISRFLDSRGIDLEKQIFERGSHLLKEYHQNLLSHAKKSRRHFQYLEIFKELGYAV
jgi:7-cyano-7-deazaguanine synthase in queuosine biosynthesis